MIEFIGIRNLSRFVFDRRERGEASSINEARVPITLHCSLRQDQQMVKLMSTIQDKDGILISQKNPEASKPQSQENKTNLHNIKAHRQRLKSIRKATTWLCKTFPDSFNWEQPKPLKRNIQHDIYAFLTKIEAKHDNQPSKTLIRNALNYYTGRYAYLKATLSLTHRIDLQGKEAEEICQTHKDYAQVLLQQKQAARKKLKEKHKEKHKKANHRILNCFLFQSKFYHSIQSKFVDGH